MTEKKILSWDVGIKNLAFCLLEKSNDGEFKILNWGVINLVDDRQKCQFDLRTGECCQENAKYYIYHRDKCELLNCYDTGNAFCCTRHKAKIFPMAREIVHVLKKSKSKPKIEIKYCKECDDPATMELTNTDYCWCDKHYEKKGQSFIKKINAKKVTVTSATRQPMQILAEKLFTKLDAYKDFLDVEDVLIENQPSLRNPAMKTIASMLYSYFVLRGVIDKLSTNGAITEVRFVSPSNKLKINSKLTNKVLDDEKNKKQKDEKSKVYKLTKKLGVKYCKALINETDNNTLLSVKKKDDMCDAFLQGFQYLFSPLPDKYFNKLKEVGLDIK